MYIAIFSHLTLLHENTSFKTSAGRFISVFRQRAAPSADQEKVLSFLPKLSCGFKCVSPIYNFCMAHTLIQFRAIFS